MILSMTGFGKADASYGEKKIHVVVKSLNSKSMDIKGYDFGKTHSRQS